MLALPELIADVGGTRILVEDVFSEEAGVVSALEDCVQSAVAAG